ncbi:GPH family glycoside/pentoside/hexuronide:cation symporter [Paenibacillus cellulosilyticus]|uniref:GPH family glycoside/pentoside/hexuronide:cation symporter n=1 Tax=Paenibacillus cellulosilyticus TaxID=375489 RepID=A0A2V2YE74_9BACL|nr:glycoside-pentoside-hexuronide (GPH):cation symporter [Paenibacillus cellulosilyticus]PWV90591.1 GPH family glycoside/pentoside/hexuronide:cation symporter [Paenibacillus cellulosilyticus]QKS45244.1 MFS transporter [Paenibacillus cellulosilyticus]
MQTSVTVDKVTTAAGYNQGVGKLKLLEKMSYGFGDMASNLMWGIIGSFLLYFYTDVALIPAVATGTIMLVARILDAVIDPVIGNMVDRTNTRFGRTRPYILFGIVPLAVMLVLTFSSPDISTTGKIVYACITYVFCGILYSLVNVPYGALMPLMTRSSEEKNQLSSYRILGMALGSIIVTACTSPLVEFLGGGEEKRGYQLTSALFAVCGVILFFFVYKNCKERYIEFANQDVKKQKGGLLETYKRAFNNGPWVSTIAFTLFMFIKIGAVVAITIFFCIHVLHNPHMISILLPAQYVSILIASPLAPVFLRKFGHRNGNIIACVIYIVSIACMPLFKDNMPAFVFCWVFGNIFAGINGGSVFGMTANAVDYNEWKFDKRCEGTLYAGYSFATKVGMAIGGSAVGYVLAFTGYDAANITSQAVSSINVLYYAVPIFCSVLQIIAVSFYRLDAIHPQVVRELEMKRAALK